MSVTREELRDLHHRLTAQAFDVMGAKNADYAKDTDPLRNFRMFEELGIVVRLSDKVARLRTFCERGVLSVKDESLEDTLVDIINYAVLFAAYIQDRKPDAVTKAFRDMHSPFLECEATCECKAPSIVDGPYCSRCEQLADFSFSYGVNKDLKEDICSNCAANAEIDTTNWDLLGRL